MIRCIGSVCILGGITGKGCDGNGSCPLEVLEERGVIARKPSTMGLDIPFDKWAQHSGGYVVDTYGVYWQIVGFIDRPAVILERANNRSERTTIIMGSEQSKGFDVLAPKGAAA